MKIEQTALPGVFLLTPSPLYRDNRGFFFESHRTAELSEALGYDIQFVQGNFSSNRPWVLRGIHYQIKKPQGKLVRAIKGSILDLAVDLRRSSPNFLKSVIVRLSEENRQAIWVPPGFGHAFWTQGFGAVVHYECSTVYVEEWNRCVRWSDPDITPGFASYLEGNDPILSPKDAEGSWIEDAEVFA